MYFVRIAPSDVQNFYTVTISLSENVVVQEFQDIPYKLAFAARENPQRSLDILRAYEAFEALMLMEDPALESEILSQRLEKLKEIYTEEVTAA